MESKPTRRPLGKGIAALIPQAITTQAENICELPIDKISANPYQPREKIKEEALEELSGSIRIHGLLQPLVVRATEDGYQLIVGERRLRAAKLAGLKVVPCIVRETDEGQLMELSLTENLQREDLNPMEEAQAYRRLQSEFRLSQEEIARRVGKSRASIANCLRLLGLPKEVQEALKQGKLSEGHARALLSVRDKISLLQIFHKVIKDQLSVRATEELIKTGAKKAKQKVELKEPDLLSLERHLMELLGTKVKVRLSKHNRGCLEIYFSSIDELNLLADAIIKAARQPAIRRAPSGISDELL